MMVKTTPQKWLSKFKKTLIFISVFWLISLISFAQTNISGIINNYSGVTNVNTPVCDPCVASCTSTITVSNGALFTPGSLALIIQMKGATIDVTNTATAGNITAIGSAGNYEFFIIESIVGNVLTARYPLTRTYDVTGVVQVVNVPEYSTGANINGTLTAQNWDDINGIGGVLALKTTTLTFNANIDVVGRGYTGYQMTTNGAPNNCTVDPNTAFVLPSTDNSSFTKANGIVVDNTATNRGRAPRANGGGSGISGDSGGGGGSNYGPGGVGGKRWCNVSGTVAGGLGGVSLSPYLALNKVFMGGGGGAGFRTTNNPNQPSDGGGIVIIFADQIIGNGFTIDASGVDGVSINPTGAPDGGGGGGAGGTVVLNVTNYTGTVNVAINGGDGQDLNTTSYHGPGGGGGGGALLYKQASLPANIALNATGGIGGQHSDGFRNDSGDGLPGGSVPIYAPPQNPSYITSPDNDASPALCDLDDDNDGISDLNESGGIDPLADADGDGVPNYQDPDPGTGVPAFVDSDGDGVSDVFDDDLDGVINAFDLDSDNDGISDVAESGGSDPDGDGIAGTGVPTVNSQGFVLIAGVPVNNPNVDSDGDGVPNSQDLDSDNDGISDVAENGNGALDANNDGIVDGTDSDGDGIINNPTIDNNTTIGGNFATPSNADGDGIPNYLDLDSDNDGVSDVSENGNLDANNDGIVDGTDTDGDGIINNATIDNNNTVGGNFANPANADGDTRPNYLDIDSDNDGITDIDETNPALDANNDGIVDGTDSDGDGIINNTAIDNNNIVGGNFPATQPNSDTNGQPNYLDIDADNDGIVDNVEGQSTAGYIAPTGTDTDGDGLDNAYDAIVGIGGAGITPVNTDGVDNPDYTDLDTDNDGSSDLVEGHDSDGNGVADAGSPADSGIGGSTDSDGDGLLDGFDNNDASWNPTNGTTPTNYPDVITVGGDRDWRQIRDHDGDGIPDLVDLDDDNDGITDLNESGGVDPLADADGDGIPNYIDTTPGVGVPAFVDTDSDGINDAYDQDQDGVIDAYDLDSDNDGISDVAESGGSDPDGNGIAGTGVPTVNAQGLVLILGVPVNNPNVDSDGDGVPNSQDLDSDNDGISDVAENGNGALDANNDGIVDGTDTDGDGIINNAAIDNNSTIGGNFAAPANADGDTRPNYLDLDSDNDGISDVAENGNGALDANNDGIVDGTDSDGDGIINNAAIDNNSTIGGNFTAPANADGDGRPNYLDLDSDNDGISDVAENGNGALDANNDGIVDGTDSDGDGIINNVAIDNNSTIGGNFVAPANADGDTRPNYLDIDSDNDGITDIDETNPALDANNDGIVDGTDSDGDGIINNATIDNNSTVGGNFPTAPNTDSNGQPNYLDIDADNDGIVDNVEGQSTAGYIAPTGTDTDGDGLDNAYDAIVGIGGAGITPVNTDGVDNPDYTDLDTDNDGSSDLVEGHDSDGNGVADAGSPADSGIGGSTDSDGDGLLDGFDNNDASWNPTNGTTPTSYPDVITVGGDRDWRQVPLANLGVTKVASNNTPAVGSNITFTITANNAGPSNATGVVINDVLPAGYTFVSSTPSVGTYDNGTGVWTIGNLANGASATLDIVVTVNATGSYANTATISGNETDPTPGNNTSTSTPVPVPQANLGVTKVASNNTPAVGSNITFTITANNAGPSNATGVVINDVLPAGYTFVSSTPSVGTYNNGTGVWTIGNLANGASATLDIVVTVNATGSYANTATISGNETDPTPGNNTSTSTPVPAPQANLGVTKVASNNTPAVGSNITFTITANNAGPSNATGVVINDVLPAGYTFVSSTPSVGTYDNGTGVWTIGNLANGASATLDIVVTVNATGSYANTATISGNETDPTPGNNTSTSTPVPAPQANLGVTKVASNNTPAVGSNITFTITANNAGPSNATGVVINDVLPAGYTFVSSTPSVGTYNNGTGVWTIGNLANGASATLDIVVTVNATGSYANTATISGNETDPTPGNNTSTSTPVPVPQANLGVTKVASNNTPAVGSNITFTITANNAGPSNATGVVINDVLPAGYTFVSSTPSVGTYNNGTGVWTIGNLANGASATLDIVVTVNATGSYANTATISGNETDPTPGNNTSTSTPVPAPQANLGVTKVASNNTPAVGSNITFTITANNAGPSNATGVVINDVLPAGYTFVSSTPSVGTYNSGTGVWTIGNLANGASATLDIVVTVNATGSYANTATISGNETDPTPGNNTSTSTPVPVPQANLGVTKVASNNTPAVGSNITFTITANNAGPSNATGVVINDVLPAGYTFVSSTPSVGTYDNGTGVWTIGNLANGASATLDIVVTVNATGSYANTATISGNETDPTPGNNTSTATPVPVNLAPTANNDTNGTSLNTPVSGGVSGNDVLPAGGTYTFTVTTPPNPAQGTVVMNPDGTYTFTPATGFVGTTTFVYQVCNQFGQCSSATVTITIGQPPVAVNDTYNTGAGIPVNGNVGTNDQNTSGGTFTLVSGGTATQNGTLVLNPNGTFTFTPNNGFVGTVTFVYQICNPMGCSQATVTINVAPLVVAVDDNYTIGVNNPITDSLSVNDILPIGSVPVFSLVNGGTATDNGTLVVNPDGTFTFTPNNGFVGTVTFTYQVCNQFGQCSTATVTINIIEPTVIIPEGFSPNNDGTNDFFIIKGRNGRPLVLKIYNRWGNLVYENNNYEDNWNGTANIGIRIGDQLPDGTYFYTAEFKDNGERYARYLTIKR